MAAAAVVVFAVLWRPWVGGPRLAFFAFGVGFAALLAGGAWWGNRMACAFAAFLVAVFAPWAFAYLLGAAYLAFGAWLAVRANRDARALVAGDGPAEAPPTSRSQRRPGGRAGGGRVTPKRRGRT